MIGVAFLDDHPAVRAGLRAIFATEPDLRLVGSADGEHHELWRLLGRTHPAVVILDLIEAIRVVARRPGMIGRVLSRVKADAAPRRDRGDHAMLALRVAGGSPVVIAATLGVADVTIADRIAAIVARLGPVRSAA
jgi:hypothetical protein